MQEMADIEARVDAVYDAVREPELTAVMDRVESRLSAAGVDPELARRTIEDLFIRDDFRLDPDLAAAVDRELDRAVAEYMDDGLFVVDVPGFDGPFHREFWRYRRDDRGTNGFKEMYVSPGGQYLALVPKKGDDLRDRAERVVTWLHNTETIRGSGHTLPATYVLDVVDRDGVETPALLAEYNRRMTLVDDMTDAEYAAVQPDLAEAGQTLSELVQSGEVAASKVQDFYGPGTGLNLAYDFVTDEVVVPELGEIHEPAFAKEVIAVDSRAEFLDRHGINDRVDRYLAAHGY